MKTKRKGFTITELVIVIAVIAILAAVLIPTLTNVVANANQSAALQTCRTAFNDYQAANFEDTSDGLVFEYNGYCYVYLNSNLQYIGEMKDFTKVETAGAEKESARNYIFDIATPADDTKITVTAGASTATVGLETKEGETAAAPETASVCWYRVTANSVTYYGVFLYANYGDAATTNVYQGARVLGGAVATGSTHLEVTVG